MTDVQKKRWDKANEMEALYPKDPYVLEHVIRIRHEILFGDEPPPAKNTETPTK